MKTRISWLKKQPKLSVTVAGLALVVAIGVVDCLANPAITFGIFYLVPILFVATAAGKMRGLLVATIAALVWVITDLLDSGIKPGAVIILLNGLDRLAVFFVSALLASTVSDLNEELKHGIEQRTHELRASETRFRQLTESISEVFWMTDPSKTKMLYVSPAYEQIWGQACASLYAAPTSWMNSIHPDDRERISQRAVSTQVSKEYDEEYRILRPDGTIRWIHDRAFPITDETGTVYRIAGIAEDITERKQAEARLTTLAHAVESTSELICITDLEDHFVFVNQAFQKVHGYTEAEILGKTPEILYSPRNPPTLLAEVLEQTRLGGWRGEVVDRRKDGTEFPVRLSTSLVKDRTGSIVGLLGVAQDISDHKRAEESLRLLSTAVQQSKESIVITDAELDLPGPRIVFVNPAFTSITGYTAAEVLGKTPRILQGPHSDRAVLGRLRQALKNGEPFLGETINYRKDGTEFFLEWQVTPIRDATRAITHFVAIQRDITDRKLAEVKVATLAHAVESTAELICITDLQDRFIFVNRAFQKAYGYTEVEVLGKTPEILFSPHNSPLLIAEILTQARLDGWRGEVLDRRKDGTDFPIRLSTSLVKDQSGQIIGLMGVAQDITERKLAENTLQESRQQLKDILDNTTAAIYVKDLAGRFILVNRYFENMFHVRREDLVDKTDFDLFTREQATAFLQNDLQVLAASAPLEFEEVAPHDDGPHTYISIKFPLFDTLGAPYAVCGISTDITERKRLEKEILEISDREQARIGHDLHDDLCQLLVSIAFDSNLLEKRLLEKSLAEAADAKNIGRLLDESITQARTLARVLSPVGLESDGLVPALKELATSVNSRRTIHCEVDCPRPVPVGNIAVATHLYRIAQEAVSNAVRHAQASRIVVGLRMRNSGITLSVTDNGIGLSDDANQRHGMGLHTMQYRARMIDGQLEIKRAESGGTRVTCRIQVRPS